MTEPQRRDFDAVPILDLSGLHSGELADRDAVVRTLRGYLENIGFLYVSGHGVPMESIAAVREASKRFHALPLEEKLKIRLDRNFRGYIPINTSTIVTS